MIKDINMSLCEFCGNEVNVEAPGWRITEDGKNACPDCVEKAVRLNYHTCSPWRDDQPDIRWTAGAEYKSESVGCGYYVKKSDCEARIVEMVKKLWPGVPVVEGN
jgi:hypothetical protein